MANTGLAKRPFSARIPKVYLRSLQSEADKTGVHRGLFFTTSGQLWCETINPAAQYDYVFRTDKKVVEHRNSG